MFQIIAIIIGVIALGIAVAGALIGVGIGFKRGIASLVSILIAAASAALLTVFLCSPTSGVMDAVLGFIVDTVSSLSPEVGEILAVEELGSAVIYYLSMIIAPFFFLIAFVLLSLILSFVIMLILSFIPILKRKPKEGKKAGPALLYHLGGVGIGLVCGVLVAWLGLFPIAGVLGIAENVVSKVPDEAIEQLGLSETLESLPFDVKSEQKAMPVFDCIGWGVMFDAFAGAKVEDEKVYLREEADVIGDIAAEVLTIDFGAKKINNSHVEVARKVVDDLDRSALLRRTLAGVAAEITKEGGLVTPDIIGKNNVIKPVVAEILSIISTSNKDTITTDLDTVVNVLGIMVENDIINESNYKKMLEKLGDGVVSELLIEVTKNERMRPVADEITILSIRVLASELGVPADREERYELLMNEIAYALGQGFGMAEDERKAQAVADLGDVFGNYGMKIEGLALEHIAEGLISDLGNKKNLSGADVEEFFAVYGIAVKDADAEASIGSGVSNLGQSEDHVVIGEDGKITVNGVTLVNYTSANYKSSSAYIFGRDGVDIGEASSLTSADDMISDMLTADDVVGGLGHYSDCEDIVDECGRVGDVFSEMISVIANISLSEFDPTEMIGGMGHALDLMKYSKIFGSDSASNIITMVLQSDTVMDALGLKRSDMTDFANKINSYAEGRENGYEEATKTIASTINTINKATDKFASTTEKTNATADLINNINKDNAEMISSMITGDMIGSFGSVTEKTEVVSDSLKNLIDNMASYKEGNPDEASVNKEAEAVTTILSLAIIGSGEDSMFDKKDEAGEVLEQGAVGSDPDSFIATVVESEVVMGTVTDTVKNGESNPYGINYSSEEEKQDVASALENYYAENANGNDEELKNKLKDLAIVMDVEIDLDQFK